jgi:hypothetical protein
MASRKRGDGEPAELTHSPRLCTDDLFTLRRAAMQGIGAVLIPLRPVADDMEGGAELSRLARRQALHVDHETCEQRGL